MRAGAREMTWACPVWATGVPSSILPNGTKTTTTGDVVCS